MRFHIHRHRETRDRWASNDSDNIIFFRTVFRCWCGHIKWYGARHLDWDAQNLAYRMRKTTHPDLPQRDPFSSQDFVDALAAQDHPPIHTAWSVSS